MHLLRLKKSPINPNVKPTKNLDRCGRLAKTPVAAKSNFNACFMFIGAEFNKKNSPKNFHNAK